LSNGRYARCAAAEPARASGKDANRTMPSLFRFLLVVGIIGGVVYGGIYALATFVNPKPREITVTVPPDKFLRR
jgi:hypothetical protein